jgi:hypothetical protein
MRSFEKAAQPENSQLEEDVFVPWAQSWVLGYVPDWTSFGGKLEIIIFVVYFKKN